MESLANTRQKAKVNYGANSCLEMKSEWIDIEKRKKRERSGR